MWRVIKKVLLFGVLAFVALLVLICVHPILSKGYNDKMQTSGVIEKKFSQNGSYSVKRIKVDSGIEKIGEIQIWYPTMSGDLIL